MTSLFGKKWARRIAIILFAIFVVVAIIVAVDYASQAVDSMVHHIREGSIIWKAFVGVFFILFLFATAIIVGLILATFVSWVIRIVFAQSVQRNIDSTLDKITALLKSANGHGIEDTKAVNQLLADTDNIRKQWNQSWVTRLTHWITRKGAKATKS